MPSKTDADVIDGVLADKVAHTCTAELGGVLVGWSAWNRLGMSELLHSLSFTHDQALSAAISVINRLVEPSSEHSLLDWYHRTGLPELMDNPLWGAGDDRFYRISDRLLANKERIEQHLRDKQMSLFNLERTVLLYDLTNTHFERLCKDNPKAKRGKNKQKRNDCPQIVVGMVFDQHGFELSHKVFDGNQSDAKSLVEMIGELNASVPKGTEKPLVIMDAGVATAANLALLREHGFGYLVNDHTLDEHDYWKLYIRLTHAEAGFKSLKTDLGLRPNPHHKEDRVDGHVFICIIAYHLLRNILWTLEQQQDYRSWETIKRIMSTHCYTTILLPTKEGVTHRIRKAGQPEECQKEIYRALAIEWTNLPSHRTTVSQKR